MAFLICHFNLSKTPPWKTRNMQNFTVMFSMTYKIVGLDPLDKWSLQASDYV